MSWSRSVGVPAMSAAEFFCARPTRISSVNVRRPCSSMPSIIANTNAFCNAGATAMQSHPCPLFHWKALHILLKLGFCAMAGEIYSALSVGNATLTIEPVR